MSSDDLVGVAFVAMTFSVFVGMAAAYNIAAGRRFAGVTLAVVSALFGAPVLIRIWLALVLS